MLPAPTIFLVSISGLVIIGIVSGISLGTLPTFVLFALIALTSVVLYRMGILNVDYTPDGGINIGFYEKEPVPAASIIPQVVALEEKEVFNVGGNNFRYDEAAAVCAAYDSELATYDQVNKAYSEGAEWCGYGWTQGGMALYPTQQATWDLLQQELDETKRTACGRPGLNGGYFDPKNKFGVNCYGLKPNLAKDIKFPLPVPGTDQNAFNHMVDRFKGMLAKFNVSSFNRDAWSKWNLNAQVPESVSSVL
jgi:hypothetical protein